MRPGDGTDRILGFADGAETDDRINLSAYHLGGLDEVLFQADGRDVVLRLGSDSLWLAGYLHGHALGDLSADDFIF
ncbi:hypothetical protein [Rubellimicrobium mesophilum]|nr:hypothetical protein [Rubellimicrobium mesophilum]